MFTVASLPDFGIHVCKRIPYPEARGICWAFTEISLFYKTTNRSESFTYLFCQIQQDRLRDQELYFNKHFTWQFF